MVHILRYGLAVARDGLVSHETAYIRRGRRRMRRRSQTAGRGHQTRFEQQGSKIIRQYTQLVRGHRDCTGSTTGRRLYGRCYYFTFVVFRSDWSTC